MPGKWWDKSWNVVTGCTSVSTGCVNCWARTLHERRHLAHVSGKDMPEQYHIPFEEVQCHPDRLGMPLRAKKPSVWFVNSMSDLFHHDVGSDFIQRTLAVMARCPKHRFIILTKRAERMAEEILNLERAARHRDLDGDLPRENSLLGISAENFTELYNRGHYLLDLAAYRWRTMVSFEPLLNDICTDVSVNFKHIDWVIAGGESGPKARYMHPGWVRALRDRCRADGTPFWFKQWGRWRPAEGSGSVETSKSLNVETGIRAGSTTTLDKLRHSGLREFVCPTHGRVPMIPCGERLAGRTLDGREWNERPADFPALPERKRRSDEATERRRSVPRLSRSGQIER